MPRRHIFPRGLLCLISILSLLCLTSASAQTYTWSNAAGGEWTNTANWTPSTNYARSLTGVEALFGDFAGAGNNIAMTMASITGLGAQTVSFSGDDNYTLGAISGAGKLRLAGTTQLVSAIGSGAHTINSPLTFGIPSSSSAVVATISNASSGVLTINRLEGVGSGGADHQLVVTGSGNTVFNTGVVNPGAQVFSVDVVKSGMGTLTFNSNPGAAINQGITIDAGAVVLGAASTHTGGTTINEGGRLVLTNNGKLPDSVAGNQLLVNGGQLDLGNSIQIVNGLTLSSGLISNGTISNTGTYNFSSGIISADLAGDSAGLVKSGPTTLTLTGRNTYAGDTVVEDGVLYLAPTGMLRLELGTDGAGSNLRGSGRLVLDGGLDLSLPWDAVAIGQQWPLTSGDLEVVYGANFFLVGFRLAGGVWISNAGGPVAYRFDQAAGVLTAEAVEPANSPYDDWLDYWAENAPGFTDFRGEADPDGDGLDNHAEFAFGSDPSSASPPGIQVVQAHSGSILISFVRRKAGYGTVYKIERNEDLLGPWLSFSPEGVLTNSANVLLPDVYERVEFFAPEGPRDFYRVRATITSAFATGKTVYATPLLPQEPVIGLPAFGIDEPTAGGINRAIELASASGGGRVLLPAQVIPLDSPVQLRSGVALIGGGTGRTILQRDSRFAFNSSFGSETTGLVSAHNAAVENILIQSLTIDGNWSAEELELIEPNVIGLRLTADGGRYNRYVAIEDVEVVNCGLGIHVTGTTDLVVRRCRLIGNGPHRLWHNAYFRRVGRILIEDNIINGALKGSGLKVTGGTSTVSGESIDLTIRRNTLHGNARNNCYVSGFEEALVEANTFSGQTSTSDYILGGLFISAENGHPSRRIDVVNNVFTDNASHGVHVKESTMLNIRGNLSVGSGLSNYLVDDSNVPPWYCDYNEVW